MPDRPPVSGEPSTERGRAIVEHRNRTGHWIITKTDILAIEAEARATPPALDVEEALHESLAAMVSISEPVVTEFARGLKRARLEHAIKVARSALRLTSKEEPSHAD